MNVAGDSQASIESFASQGDLRQRFIVNGRRLARHYNITATPTTIYLDTQGRMVHRQLGGRHLEEMRERIEAILPE